jgi:hypothetical protein
LALKFTQNGKSAQDALNVMPAYQQALKDSAGAVGVQLSQQELLEYAMGKVPQSMLNAMSATQKYTDTAGQVKPLTPTLQKSLDDAGVSADGLATDLQKVLDGMLATGMATVSARDAQAKFAEASRNAKSAMDDLVKSGVDVSKALNKNHTDFDLTTAAGEQANAKFEEVRSAGLELAKSLAGPGVQAQQQVQGALTQTYNNLVTSAEQMGITKDGAEKLARSVLGVPPGVNIKTWMSDYARQKAAETEGAVKSIPTSVGVTVTYTTDASGFYDPTAGTNGSGAGSGALSVNKTRRAFAAGGLVAFATGGLVGGYPAGGLLTGPGTGTSDSMLARVSNGEFVMTAAAVKTYGVGFMSDLNRRALSPAIGSSRSAGSLSTPGSTPAAQTPAGRSVTNHITVNAQTNASAPRIASEIGFTLGLMA